MLFKQAERTIRLSLPIILGELAQISLHLIDSAMIGAVGYKHLAAAALAFNVVNIPFVLGIGITISVSQMVALARGRRDRALISHYLYNGFWLCAAAAAVISLSLQFATGLLYRLDQDPQVVEYAVPFMRLLSWSIVPMLLFLALKHFTDGLELTRVAMTLSILALPINAAINWLLIFGRWGFPRLELVGAGWGTLITRSLIFVVLAIIVLTRPIFSEFVAVRGEQWTLRRETLRDLLRIGVPSGLQMGLEVGAFGVSAILIGMIDAVSLAAHQIAIGCAGFTFLVAAGLSQGSSIRTSNALGRGDWTLIAAIGKSTLLTALAWGAFCALNFVVFREQLSSAFSREKPVVALAATLMFFAALFQISDSVQAICAGLLRGIKDVKVPTILISVAYWVVGLPAGYVLAFYFDLGAVGMWLGFIVGLTFSAAALTMRFLNRVRRRERGE